MKHTIILFLFSCALCGQTVTKNESPIKTVERIFKDFGKYDDHLDSDENKEQMKRAFILLKDTCDNKDLEYLLWVWMFYDPTDFKTRELMNPIFVKYKKATLGVINKMIVRREKNPQTGDITLWEDIGYLSDVLENR